MTVRVLQGGHRWQRGFPLNGQSSLAEATRGGGAGSAATAMIVPAHRAGETPMPRPIRGGARGAVRAAGAAARVLSWRAMYAVTRAGSPRGTLALTSPTLTFAPSRRCRLSARTLRPSPLLPLQPT